MRTFKQPRGPGYHSIIPSGWVGRRQFPTHCVSGARRKESRAPSSDTRSSTKSNVAWRAHTYLKEARPSNLRGDATTRRGMFVARRSIKELFDFNASPGHGGFPIGHAGVRQEVLTVRGSMSTLRPTAVFLRMNSPRLTRSRQTRPANRPRIIHLFMPSVVFPLQEPHRLISKIISDTPTRNVGPCDYCEIRKRQHPAPRRIGGSHLRSSRWIPAAPKIKSVAIQLGRF